MTCEECAKLHTEIRNLRLQVQASYVSRWEDERRPERYLCEEAYKLLIGDEDAPTKDLWLEWYKKDIFGEDDEK